MISAVQVQQAFQCSVSRMKWMISIYFGDREGSAVLVSVWVIKILIIRTTGITRSIAEIIN
jgi:hypothetical protein